MWCLCCLDAVYRTVGRAEHGTDGAGDADAGTRPASGIPADRSAPGERHTVRPAAHDPRYVTTYSSNSKIFRQT